MAERPTAFRRPGGRVVHLQLDGWTPPRARARRPDRPMGLCGAPAWPAGNGPVIRVKLVSGLMADESWCPACIGHYADHAGVLRDVALDLLTAADVEPKPSQGEIPGL